MAKQDQQDAEGLRLDRQTLARPGHGELAFPDLHVRERENKGVARHHNSITPPWNGLSNKSRSHGN